jgi:gliding motility-associated-like protein
LESNLLLPFMRKCLLLAALLISFSSIGVQAQRLFDFESDTVCVGQQVRIIPRTMNASSYYWGFCSGYLQTTPDLLNLGDTFGFHSPTSIEIAKDGDEYFGFVLNGSLTQLLRLNFGKSLMNIPSVVNLGSIDTTVPLSPNSLYITKDSGKWFLFAVGGGGTAPNTLARFDFGKSLANKPNGVNMGNPGGLLNDPRGIFVSRDLDGIYFGFVVNAGNSRLIRLNFGNNISRTPSATNVVPITGGGPGAVLNGPRDIAPVYDQGVWYFFIPNLTGNTVSRLYFGNTLSNTPTGSIVTSQNPMSTTRPDQPSAISIVKDCGSYTMFVTNRGNDQLYRYNINSFTTTTYARNATYSPPGIFNAPADITRVVRDRDSLYAFVINATDSSLVRAIFPQCHDANIQSSTLAQPPTFKYDSAGTHNVYLAVNEGQPNMDIECRTITVVSVPPITITRDTMLCQGDTLHVFYQSQFALGYFYTPHYNLSDTEGRSVYVYPDRSYVYNVHIPFPNGCVIDTPLRVAVSQVKADAGPDRTLLDGASTIIGGPNTVTGPQFTYEWFPAQYISNPLIPNPVANPSRDITYYLKITNTDRCVDIDTVNIKVTCADLNLPNAFAPDNQREAPRSFGILNKQIVKLNYFRIFDRWGKEVFSTTDVTKEWDGTVNGNPAPYGVYVWEADGFCLAGQRISKSGNVTLLR